MADSDEQEIREATLANRFDIRRLIGAVFVVYGLILTALGVFGSSHVKNKAAGTEHRPLGRARDADLRGRDDRLGAAAPRRAGPAGAARPRLGPHPPLAGHLAEPAQRPSKRAWPGPFSSSVRAPLCRSALAITRAPASGRAASAASTPSSTASRIIRLLAA